MNFIKPQQQDGGSPVQNDAAGGVAVDLTLSDDPASHQVSKA